MSGERTAPISAAPFVCWWDQEVGVTTATRFAAIVMVAVFSMGCGMASFTVRPPTR